MPSDRRPVVPRKLFIQDPGTEARAVAYLTAFGRHLHPVDIGEAVTARAAMAHLASPWRTDGIHAPGRGRA